MSTASLIRTSVALSSVLLALAACGSSGGSSADDLGTAGEGISAPTCAPQLANGAVPQEHKALLNTIAFTEGTAGHGEDGYNVTYAYHYFASCDHHPNLDICSGGLCSTAAGRYQFLTTTWDGLGYANFHPDNQDRGAMKLVARRGALVPSDRALTATEFVNVMDRISYEWASLPPGRYGQPSYSMDQTRAKYCTFANCNGGGGGPTGGSCTKGGAYCGGDKVSGDSSTLYRCEGPGTPSVIAHCAAGCQVMSGTDDVCRGSGGCDSGGFYCGGDKVTGDPNTLYRCTGGSSGTVSQHCANGCSVNSGRDDSCR
jgi:muramidase (phage lysozyme)